MSTWLPILLLLLAGIAVLAGSSAGTLGGFDISDIAIVMASVALLLFYLPSVIGGYGGRMSQGLRDAVTWAVFCLVLIAGYSFKSEILLVWQRVAGELTPPGTAIDAGVGRAGERSVRIRKSGSHFKAQTQVNGSQVGMLVDTGASSIVLQHGDALRVGIDVGRLQFTIPVQTANGQAFAAPATLRSVALGPIEFTDLDVLVAKPGALRESLLGMNFLRRLRSYEFSGDYLTLRY